MANEAGAGCVSRGSTIGGYTFVSQGAPASIAGNVTRLAFYKSANEYTTVNFAFFTASVNDLTTVAGTLITGLTAAASAVKCEEYNSPGDFSEFAVSSGNYVGHYGNNASYYSSSGGSGAWYKSGNNTNVSGVTFSNLSSGIDSLEADITAAGGSTLLPIYRNQKRMTNNTNLRR